jgi:glycosyltransferase involved in cell wall biosynthesis
LVLKIDLVGPAYPFRGGISSFTTLLFRAMAGRHETRYYSFRRQYPAFLYPGRSDRDESPRAPREAAAQPLLDSLDPATWLRVAARIVHGRPDLLLLPWWSAYWTAPFLTIASIVKRRTEAKVLILCHNVEDHGKGRFAAPAVRLFLRRGDRFLVFSTDERDKLARIVGRRPIGVTRHPSYGPLGLEAVPKAAARRALGLAENKIILFFGYVRPYKGLDVLLEAMPRILERTDARLLVAGEFWGGSSRTREKIRARGIAGKVTIIDRYLPYDEIPLVFGAADLLVLPYLSVTACGPLQMAQTFRLPVVASRLGSLADNVLEGRTGFLAPPGDPVALAETIVGFFARGDAAAMAEAIAARDAEYGWDRIVADIEEIVVRPTS